MGSLRRAPLAMLGDPRMAKIMVGGNKDDKPMDKSIDFNSDQSFSRGTSLVASGQIASEEEQKSIGSSPSLERTKVASLVRGQLPVIESKPLTQDDFVDALTAVVTGKVDFMDNNNQAADDDDGFSFTSLSTICSRLEVNSQNETKEDQQLTLHENKSLVGMGEMFFYIDPTKRPMDLAPSPQRGVPPSLPIRVRMDESSMNINQSDNQLSLVAVNQGKRSGENSQMISPEDDLAQGTPPRELPLQGSAGSSHFPLEWSPTKVDGYEHEMYYGRSVASIRSIIEESTRNADRDGLFEKGCEMYREGERLLYEGHIEEARHALQKAHSFQKRALRLITGRMADVMHQQGLAHCDRGDKYLAIILLGVSEIIKHRPSAANIQLGAQVFRGYKRVCPKEEKFIAARKEVRNCIKIVGREALPIAKTLDTYSKALTMSSRNSS